MAATRTVPGAAPTGPLTKAQRKAALQQSAAAPLASQKGDPSAVNVEVKPKDEGSTGRPDKKAYDDEQNELRSQIDALQAKANDLRNKISSTSVRGGPDHERKLAIRKEMDELRAEQAKGKGGREKTLEKLKQMQDALKRKIDDMTAARSKVPYKTVQDVDNQIKSLERQVESGSMKLVDEKKALSEISSLRKSRKVVESFAAQQAAIDADKAKIDEVRKELDDPEQKAVSKKMGELRKELDEINKKFDEVSKNRDGLFEERNAISKQLDELFDKKKASTAAWREANNKYYKKIEEDRQKRDERRKAERKAAEESKRAEVNQRLLEEAQAPAFEREIEDCKTLIRFFQQRIGLAPADGSAGANGGALFNRPKVAGVPELEIRKVDAGDLPKGTVLKKKGEQEEESWGGLAKSKGKKGRNAAPAAKNESATAPASDDKLNLPFGTLTALMTLGITAPLTTGEVQKTIDSLQLKMKYFTDNQDRVTKERIAAVEAKIAKAASSSGSAEIDAVASTDATATEEKIKDAQPQPIEENGSKEEAVKSAEGETEVAADAATEDAKEDA